VELNIDCNLGIIRELHPGLKNECQVCEGQFTPEVADALSEELDIPKNIMFLGSLTHTQIFSMQDLGGVRIIW
jgi:hypothetical protein